MLMLIAIAGAMAFKIGVEIYTGHYFRFIIALGKYDAQVLMLLLRITFQGIGGAGTSAGFRFAVVDLAVLHNILYFFGGYMAAFHPALGMFGIFEKTRPPVEAAVAVHLIRCRRPGVFPASRRLAGGAAVTYDKYQQGQYDQ